ncbi:hypothetical protein LU699_01510 [Luteimonas fraxinea]|uniref:Uncharacterized protein n=1 Tax=Luteimonas fraxinea TaxID=2901869 RepID=A0ABS8UJW4_9GAMM|nr:hypothetical protein [Luteimonas fraxinea]MCD9098785.1 hypothetical protein [Luteimonas fraxinea]MCD9127468.1 hypothetical protein [Luteimonas fraxinea]UHH10438.1 hypothetical protein LU699_01510 [Luteimonas fraxinea]
MDTRSHKAGSGAQPPVISASDTPGDIGACKHIKPRFLRVPLLRSNRPRTTNDIMQSYVGDPAPIIVSRWGAPTTSYDNRDGSRILTWRNEWSGCTQTVLIDPQDIISRWRYSGCDCLRGRDGPPKGTPIPPMTL